MKLGNLCKKTSSCEKLFEINFDYKLNFEKHIEDICQKASRKLNALARFVPYIGITKRRTSNGLMNAFFKSRFNYSPLLQSFRSSRPEVFLGKGVLRICSKFTGEHPSRIAISMKLQRNFIEITLRHACSLVNLLHIFRTPFLKNTSGRLLLNLSIKIDRLHERCLCIIYSDTKQ